MEEKNFVTVNFSKKYLDNIVTGKDGEVYRNIILPGGSSILRRNDQIKQSEYKEDEMYFMIPDDFVFNAKTRSKDSESGEYVETSQDLSVSDLKDRFNNPEFYEAENEFVTITCNKNRIMDVFVTKENKECVAIAVTEDTRIIRKTEQVKEIEGTDLVRFALPKDFEIHALKTVKSENGYQEEQINLSIASLQEFLKTDLQGFVKFIVPKKYVSEPHVGKNDKSFCFVNIPGVGSFIRNAESIKPTKSDAEKVVFYIPAGVTVKVTKNHRIAGVPDEVPDNEKYRKEEQFCSVIDLKREINQQLKGREHDNQALAEENEIDMPDFEAVEEMDEIPDFFQKPPHKTR